MKITYETDELWPMKFLWNVYIMLYYITLQYCQWIYYGNGPLKSNSVRVT